MIIIYPEEMRRFLEANANKVDCDGKIYWHYPFWLSPQSNGTIEQISFEKLPEKVKNIIRESRGIKNEAILKGRLNGVLRSVFNRYNGTDYEDKLRLLAATYTEADFFSFRNVGVGLVDVAKIELKKLGLSFKQEVPKP